VFLKTEAGNANGFVDLRLFGNRVFSGATLSNFLLNGAAGTLIVVLTLVQEAVSARSCFRRSASASRCCPGAGSPARASC
jgi:DHA2 family multidrug resistance protein-like MFS transporter